MKRYLMAAVLVLCLLLSSCGENGEPVVQATSRLSEAAGMEEEQILLTMDGREVPAWRYLYWLGYACERVEDRYRESKLPLDWSTPVAGGTLADYVKDQALADTALYAAVENWAERYNCTPAESETETPALPDMGLSRTQMEELEQVGRMYAALYELYCTEGSELAPTEDELAAFGTEQGAVTLDRILIPVDGDREAAQKRSAEVFSRINSAEDQAAVFSMLATEGGDPLGPRTLLPETEELEPELVEAALALEEGQCSGILETEAGFSVLRRLPLETGALKEAYFDHLLETAAESSVVTTTAEYEALDAAEFAENFLVETEE